MSVAVDAKKRSIFEGCMVHLHNLLLDAGSWTQMQDSIHSWWNKNALQNDKDPEEQELKRSGRGSQEFTGEEKGGEKKKKVDPLDSKELTGNQDTELRA